MEAADAEMESSRELWSRPPLSFLSRLPSIGVFPLVSLRRGKWYTAPNFSLAQLSLINNFDASPWGPEALPLSIAHPLQNNLVVIFSDVYVFSNTVASVPPCPLNTWCHVAVSINVNSPSPAQ